MNGYQDYMDRILVSKELHNKIMHKMITTVPRRFPVHRYLAAAACMMIVLAAAWAHLQSPAGPGKTALHFNQAGKMAAADKRHIPGYFTQELSPGESAALFGDTRPLVWDNYTVNASAGFSGEGVLCEAVIICEDKNSGRRIRFFMADNLDPIHDFIYLAPPEVSDVNGTPVLAGYWTNPSRPEETIHYCSFNYGETEYYLEITGGENNEIILTGLVNRITAGDRVDLSKITPDAIPEWRDEVLTLRQAQADPVFGAYVPLNVPAGFSFQTARRLIGQNQDGLNVTYENGMRYISLAIARRSEDSDARIVDLRRRETYDLALYPVPRANSVPDELRTIVANPVFLAEELTPEAVNARAYQIDDAGDDNTGFRMRFGVSFGETVVTIDVKGAWPADIFALIKDMSKAG